MTVDEADRLLRAEPVMLALDTSAVWGSRARLVELLLLVSRANDAIASGRGPGFIGVCVSALVHAERTRQLRTDRAKRGLPFSIDEIDRSLAHLGLWVHDFTRRDAEGTSDHIFHLYPSDDAWRRAKQQKGSDSATVDWFIAGHAAARRWLAVTEDTGPEWTGLVRVVGWTVLVRSLKQIIGE